MDSRTRVGLNQSGLSSVKMIALVIGFLEGANRGDILVRTPVCVARPWNNDMGWPGGNDWPED